MTARVFTIPAGEPFLERLSRALLAGDLPRPGSTGPDPLSLPDITLFLPTRRATRALETAFLDASESRALLLPRIRPISQGEEELTLLTRLAGLTPAGGAAAFDLPEAVGSRERTLWLMQLVQAWRAAMERASPDERSAGANTPSQAAALANDLAKLMDLVETENVALSNLSTLVPDTFAAHWQQTIEFLRIVTEFWPKHLADVGKISQTAERNALILAEAERLSLHPPEAPVIIAGVTGSIPATVELMRAVLGLANGAIVLPALDLDLDGPGWEAVSLSPEHPQYGLKKLLDTLGIAREDVAVLPGPRAAPARQARARLVSEAMRPSSTTEHWHDFAARANPVEIVEALSGVSLIEAPGTADEAEAIALILREAVETPGRTAALVSPDRLLARRVAIRLQSWGIRVDDSAGRPFKKTVPGTLLDLVVDVAVKDFAPAALMALLKHPLCRLRLAAFDVRRFARALELIAFRAPYLGRGLGGVAAAIDHAERAKLGGARQHDAVRRLWDEDWAGARDLVGRLERAFEPLAALYCDGAPHALRDFAAAHADVAERLAALPENSGDAAAADANPLWQGEAGELANNFFVEMLGEAIPALDIAARDYADLYRTLTSAENVRERTPVHPRVSIWGPFEARLQQPDIVILGSLNEGTWPEPADPGAWLNRPMRAALKLPAPEEDIGRAAHDFVSLMGAERVYLTRAQKVKGVPAVPSRWLMRLTALLDGLKAKGRLTAEAPWLGWARARDGLGDSGRIFLQAPAPCPPANLRPRRLSVTRVETWIKNPYAIFAGQILKLNPLPALGEPPVQSLRGALVHEVLSEFAIAFPDRLPADIDAELEAIAARVLEAYTGHPRIAAFWMPRLRRFLAWFAATETDRRQGVARVLAETSGSMVLDAPGGPFTLTARADRIDDGEAGLAITDYKTGVTPNAKAVLSGRSPQLPLEAAIALSDSGFTGSTGKHVAALRYIRASGGEPPGEQSDIRADDLADVALAARNGLERLVSLYDRETTPYRALRRPGYRYDYDDYATLARVAEWSAHVDEDV